MEGGRFAELSEGFAGDPLECQTMGVVAHGFEEDGDSSPPDVVGEDGSASGLGIEDCTPQFLNPPIARELAQCLEAFFDVKVAIAQLTSLLHLKVDNFGRVGGDIGGIIGVVVAIIIGEVI